MARKKIEVTAKDAQQIEVMAGLGLTVEQIATVLGISPRTFNRWCQDPTILAHYKKGLDTAQVQISQTLFQKAKDGDTTAIIWYEKTRAGRKEVSQVEVVDERVKAELRDFLDFLKAQLPPAQFTQLLNDYDATRRRSKRIPGGK
jgi:hypothetical protein